MSVAFADRTFIVYFSLSPSIHLFPRFQANSHIREEYACTYVYVLSDFMVLRSFNTILPRCRGQTTRCEKRIVRRTWIYGRIGLLSFSLYHLRYLQHHHACISASNASHGRSGNTPTHTQKEEWSARKRGGCRVGQDRLQVRDEQGWGKQRVLPVYGRPPMRLMRVLFHTPKTVL